MNELKLVFFGLIAIVTSVILLWILEAPEIIEDKEIEITISLGVGLMILILDRRADRRIHEIIHEQHILIKKYIKRLMNKMS
jgi:hypothetical protein